MAEEHVKCLIIGSGPAGYTAAVYAARANLSPVLYTGSEPGGQLIYTSDVENYPGYPEGVLGPEMMEDFRKQAERFGTDIRFGLVSDVDLSSQPYKVTIDETVTLTADTIIISTGASAKWLGLPAEDKFKFGGGVTACAVCDGAFYKGMDVAVVGAGDTACEEVSYLSKLCNKVYMIVRRDEMRASKIMQQRVLKAKNVEIIWNSETVDILGEEEVEAVKIKNNKTGEESELPVKGFFVAIGHKPNTDVFAGKIDMDPNGYIVTKGKSTLTNIPGVFACGDVQDHIYRQAVTAAGTGCMAALDAERYLAEKEMEPEAQTA